MDLQTALWRKVSLDGLGWGGVAETNMCVGPVGKQQEPVHRLERKEVSGQDQRAGES